MMGRELQPKLRFPGYRGDWETSLFTDVFQIIDGDRGVNYPKSNEFFKNEYCLFLNAKNVTKKGFDFTNTMFITEDKDRSLNNGKLNRNDIILTTRGTVGNFAYYDNEITFDNLRINSGMVILRLANCNIRSNYVYAFSNSVNFRRKLNTIIFGSAQPQLTVGEIRKFKISYPSIPEQQKIADYLSTIDRKISLLEEKKAELTRYKKTLMQKLFSQELRFKDKNGRSFEDWKATLFKDLFEFKSTNSLSRDKLNYRSGEVKNIHYGDIHVKFRTLFNIKKENVPFINSHLNLSKIPQDIYVKEGDIIIADASENYEDIGKAIEVLNIDNEKVVSGLHTFLARRMTNDNFISFMSYLMKSHSFRRQVHKIAQGTKVLSLSSTRFGNLKFNLPSIPEQQKIADFFYYIDESIYIVEEQIQQTTLFKKAMLQQMFV